MTCWLCGFETINMATDAQAPMCNNGPCKICTAVTEIDEEIDQAVAVLRRLMAKRRDLRSEHNRVHGTLMNRLPVELKSRIFELLLPERDEWGEIPAAKRMTMRSFLASMSVCRRWRDVALSNPFLWSTIRAALGTSNQSRLFNDWILRSRTLPVIFHLQVRNRKNCVDRSREVLPDLMNRYSDRLQSLSLHVPLRILCGSQHNNFQYHQLTRLRIISSESESNIEFNQPLSLLNPTASPEKIELEGVPIPCLQISWNRLTSAKVKILDLEDIAQLFQHAPQMTNCEILAPDSVRTDSLIPPIIHHGLKTLTMYSQDWGVLPVLLASLTLPCLQVLSIDETDLLTLLPAFVRRSSCPLTKLILRHDFENDLYFDEHQPLTGVTDLVVDSVRLPDNANLLKRLLLDRYFPDLRHLTLRRQPFETWWNDGFIHLLLDRKRAPPDKPNQGRLDKILVVDQDRASWIDSLWKSDIGVGLKMLNSSVREGVIEIL